MAARFAGELKTWHKTTLDFAADVSFSETASTFRDYRLDVTFTHQATGAKIKVPGFFAADGDAADTGATSGKIWRVNFNAPLEGKWTYEASFRSGKDIAVSTDSKAGSAVAYIDGETGSFSVSRSDKTGEDFRAKGMILQDEGTHYLQHQGDGDYFVRGGPGVPENFLATAQIDNTPDTHDFSSHTGDYNSGDPTWAAGKGKNILGAVNYLAERGQNSVYVMTLTAAGDGKDVWPWAATNLGGLASHTAKLDPAITSVYDISKLAQWEIVFDFMDKKGLYKNVLLQENENDQLLDGGTDAAGTSLSVERLIYMREMVARFGHNNGIQWNLGEENTNTSQQRADMSEWLKTVDPYDHLVVVHTWATEIADVYDPLLGEEAFDGTSFQTSSGEIRGLTEAYRNKSAAAGDPWVLNWDENSTRQSMLDPYSNNPDSTKEQDLRKAFWGFLTAGGSGVNWYVRQESGQSYDQTMDVFDRFESLWTWTAAGTKFFNTYIPFWEMREADALTADRNDYVLADPGNYYAIYLPYGEASDVRLDLSGQSGETFVTSWYDPRTGGDLIAGEAVSGGSVVQIGGAPSSGSKDWVLLVRNKDMPVTPKPGGAPSVPGDPAPEPEEGTGLVARDDSAVVQSGDSVRIFVLGNDEDPDGTAIWTDGFTQAANGSVRSGSGGRLIYSPDAGFSGTDRFTYTAIDANGDTAVATVTVTVSVGGGEVEPPPPPDGIDDGLIARDDSAVVRSGDSVRIHVLGNDEDPDGTAIWIDGFGQAAHGSVSSGGGGRLTYAPDAGFSGTDSFTYTAIDANGDTAVATVTVGVGVGSVDGGPPAPTGGTTRLAIDAGGGGGGTFSADAFASGGKAYSTGASIDGTDDDAIYRTERFGRDFSYDLEVENGDYEVTLKFAEIYWDSAGRRRFDVLAEDRLVIEDLDVFKKAGGKNIAYDVVVPVTVKDGRLDLDFVSDVNNAKIGGIVVAPKASPSAQAEAEAQESSFAAPFDLSGSSLGVGDVFLFGFDTDGNSARVVPRNGQIGVSGIGSGTEIDYRGGAGSEMIGFDFNTAARGVTLDLGGLYTVRNAAEGAIFRTYAAHGEDLAEYLVTSNKAVTLAFNADVRFASLEAAPWIGDGDLPSTEPDFFLESFSLA